ncbi:MAG TPA: hypothetical protein PLU53_03435 [Bacteroidia bacterium]|nr:hypothetical protein [Bacteroidia bacterium]
MKTIVYTIAIIASIVQVSYAEEIVSVSGTSVISGYEITRPCTLVITISGGLHKKKDGCIGLALGCLDISFRGGASARMGDNTDVGLEMRNASVLTLSAHYPDKITDSAFEVEEDTPVAASVCEQLGYSSILIKKGMYKYTRDKSNILSVDLSCLSKK